MNEQNMASAAKLANAVAEYQLKRPFAAGLRHLTEIDRQFVRSLMFSAVTDAIETWEKARPVRERSAFYGGQP